MEIIKNRKNIDEERAFYGANGLYLIGCEFDGPADGESAFKEASDNRFSECLFNLRYPFWHNDGLVIENSEMTPLCRAALWYSKNLCIRGVKMHGIKALRECENAEIDGCDIISPEFGWSSKSVTMKNTHCQSEYFMLRGSDLHFENIRFEGKYSFQYIENAEFDNCVLDTKDAFWHCKNVRVRNCELRGEYAAWYSENLTLENCRIYGTQPFCYCKNLKLIGCEMTGTDLAFEKSEVCAEILTPVVSIKNPKSGKIVVPEVGQIIADDPEAACEIITG